jgi:hypothetical protein
VVSSTTEEKVRVRGLVIAVLVCATPYVFGAEIYEEIRVGYANDFAVELGFRLDRISPELPFSTKISGGYIRQVSAGNADDARQVFINNATNGSPSEYGESWYYGVTLGYDVFTANSFHVTAFATGKQNRYSAYFIFTGGNEAFRVTTTQFGVGGGLELTIRSAPGSTGFTLGGGAEYYFPSRIDSHGTYFYTPDGTDSRPREDFTYLDADATINQPRLRPFVALGVQVPIRLQ